jgi:3,4-dehydroadipyl-CoA semialdehyde dehydrogenase
MGAEALESYLGGRWSRGHGAEINLVDPTNGSVLATVSAPGLDLKAALAFAREHGGPALRALSYAERAKLLGAIVRQPRALRGNRYRQFRQHQDRCGDRHRPVASAR